MSINKIYTFKNGMLNIYPKFIEYKTKNGKSKQSMSRFNIGGVNKEYVRILERQVMQYGFLFSAIGIGLLIFSISTSENETVLTYLSAGSLFIGLFLVVGFLFFDGLLGIKLTTEVCLLLFGIKGYKISIQNDGGGDHIEFFLFEKEIFDIEEIANYKLVH
ncbi:hypothetical protein [Ferruginibacter albus]|uniref:hypothetical protein n=1 Tax=Ferruginibacter albus TaxID=2875540 RepID=UPI001CC764CF|nr:hypothetical protein [Ferruginibacter albus]UAY52742.1 hypothetical protein K9M53_03380 [Ferruginibacter albus]